MSRVKRNGLHQRAFIPPSTCEMFAATHLVGFGAGGDFSVLGVDFDGTNDFLARASAFSGAAASKQGTVSYWMRIDGGDGSRMVILDPDDTGAFWCALYRHTDNKFYFAFQDSAPSGTFSFHTTVTKTASGTWFHQMASWRCNGVGTFKQHVAFDGVVDTLTDDSNIWDLNIDYTRTSWRLGQGFGSLPGAGLLNGCLAEFWFAPGTYLDLTTAANIALFRGADGKPRDLGADGSLPTGSAPLIYLSCRPGDAASAFATNRGTGGDFTITGSLDLASTNPSD